MIEKLRILNRKRTRSAAPELSALKSASDDGLRNALEAELARLVALPTFSSGTDSQGSIISLRKRTSSQESAESIEMIAAELKKYGLSVTMFEQEGYKSVIATTRRTRRPHIMLQAHIDVISANSPELRQLRLADGKYMGRGVYDMKFAIACYMQFVRTHRKQLHRMDFGIMITSDEEVGGFHGAKPLAEQGWGGDIMINPDGGNDWRVESQAKGIWMADIVATGKSAHGSRPWEGDSAVDHLIPALNEIMQLFDNRNKLAPTCNIGKLSAGEAFNQVAGSGHAVLDIRSFSEADVEALELRMQRIAKRHKVACTIEKLGPPVTIDEESPLVRSFAAHVAAVTGKPCRFTVSYGATDSRWFDDPAIQNIVVRPHGGGSHGDDEWMSAEDLAKFYLLIESFVLDNAAI